MVPTASPSRDADGPDGFSVPQLVQFLQLSDGIQPVQPEDRPDRVWRRLAKTRPGFVFHELEYSHTQDDDGAKDSPTAEAGTIGTMRGNERSRLYLLA